MTAMSDEVIFILNEAIEGTPEYEDMVWEATGPDATEYWERKGVDVTEKMAEYIRDNEPEKLGKMLLEMAIYYLEP